MPLRTSHKRIHLFKVFMSNTDFSKALIAEKDKEVTLQQCKPVYYIFYIF